MFKVGDVVVLKSGSHHMTVTSSTEEATKLVWCKDGEMQFAEVATGALKIPPKQVPVF